jgi:hypothetical protein
MIKLSNGMAMEIAQSWYNKTKVQEDGITQIPDTSKAYPYFKLAIDKVYFDIEDKGEVVLNIVDDLREMANYLEQIYDKEYAEAQSIQTEKLDDIGR